MEWLAQQDNWFAWTLFWVMAVLQFIFYVVLICVAYEYVKTKTQKYFDDRWMRKAMAKSEYFTKKYRDKPQGTYFEDEYAIEVGENGMYISHRTLKKEPND